MVFSLQSNIKNVYRESMGKYARFRRKGAKMRESVSGGVPFLAATQSLLARSHTFQKWYCNYLYPASMPTYALVALPGVPLLALIVAMLPHN